MMVKSEGTRPVSTMKRLSLILAVFLAGIHTAPVVGGPCAAATDHLDCCCAPLEPVVEMDTCCSSDPEPARPVAADSCGCNVTAPQGMPMAATTVSTQTRCNSEVKQIPAPASVFTLTPAKPTPADAQRPGLVHRLGAPPGPLTSRYVLYCAFLC